ncbi:HAD-IIB family hydrolase [Mycoplasmopsis agalactiae]|uniref:Uncharacterized protein n=2 Tax=Bacteria TaxID=2 RepID=D3VR07_MYCAA|nr:HAD-IIB family hydrolase [Mycoplasmopsis agalactiae]KAB6718434.1 HAD-IIB family hydrolase [Mycoplasmopsis agalactiae]CBH40754.1 Conserved hypothetical protein [Mycoplasmopsis agalactiae]
MDIENNKTYFIDLDGTLFDKKVGDRISHRNLTAMLLVKNFANIVINTGRSYNDKHVMHTMHRLGISDAICSSGAEIYINSVRKYAFFIDTNVLPGIIEFARNNKLMLVIFDQNGESIYTQHAIEKFFIKFFASSKFHIISTFKKLDVMNHINITKIALVVKNKFKAHKILAKFNSLFDQYCNSHLASANYVIEVTSAKTNKGLAVSLYMQEKQINPKDAVHIGDSDSDLTTRAFVGHLVAMKNGTSKLKSAADEIAPKSKNGGIYKYFIERGKKIKGA